MKNKLGQKLTKRAVAEFLKDPSWTLDTEAMEQYVSDSYTAYRHSNGQFLLTFDRGRGVLYYSRDEFFRRRNYVQEEIAKGPRSILHGRIPQGQAFPDHVPALVAQIPALFKVPTERLDFSGESLDVILKSMRRIGYRKCFEAPYFPPLAAYLGENLRRNVNGTWQMRLSRDGITWDPWIVAGEYGYFPWNYLYDVIVEDGGRGLDLKAIIGFEIAHPHEYPGRTVSRPILSVGRLATSPKEDKTTDNADGEDG